MSALVRAQDLNLIHKKSKGSNAIVHGENEVVGVQNLSLAYGKNEVISSANFTISQGDFVCVVGSNGSGKSTLIKAILGLIKLKSGEIVFGEDVTKNTIGYLPQEFKLEQDFPATVFEIVLSGAVGRLGRSCFFRQAEKKKALDNLKILKMKDLKDKSFVDLSGGQKQKVLLARALTSASGLLILDEPSNNLDYSSRKDFYETLKELNSKYDMTIIMITHDLDAKDLIGNKVLAIEEGAVMIKSTEEYLRSFK